MKNKHRILNGGHKRTLLGGPEEREARKAFQKKKAMEAFRKVVFVITNQKTAQARISSRTKAEERTKKERARQVLIPNLDFQLGKHPVKKDGNRPIGLPTIGVTIPQPQLLGALARELIVHG